MSKLYKIRDWNSIFENNRSRELKTMSWVAVPNKHDGENFSSVMAHKNGAVIFSSWVLMVQVASKCDPRGTLLRGSKKPHTPQSLSLITRAPEAWFRLAIDFLEKETDWLVVEELAIIPQEGAEKSHSPADPSIPFLSIPSYPSEGGCKGEANPISVRLCRMFGRRSSTIWDDREKKKLIEIGRLLIPEDEWVLVEEFYASDAAYKRTDLSTFMNNVQGEIDRARNWKKNPKNYLKNGHQTVKPNPRNAGVIGADTAGSDAKRAVQAMEAKRDAAYALAAKIPQGPEIVPSESSVNGHGGRNVLLPFCEKLPQ